MKGLADKLLGRIKEQRRRIVIVGDILIDRYVHGYLAPCQDSCNKFVEQEIVEVPGGAANAERSIENWDTETLLIGQRENCPVKCRYVEDGRIVFRSDYNESVKKRPPRHVKIEDIDRVYGVLISDYDKGFLLPERIREIAAVCRERGIPCVADCKREPEVYEGCILKANKEWGFRHRPSVEYFVETNGENPPLLWHVRNNKGGFCHVVKCNKTPVPCVNHVGAGDCFAAHLVLALAYGFTLAEAATLAHSAGRVYVQFEHNRPPQPSEIAADLAGHFVDSNNMVG